MFGYLCLRGLIAGVALMSTAISLLALNSVLPPGGNFDLSHWKCTLPDGTATEISPSRLVGGYTSEFFYTGSDGAMTFWCPVTGGTTPNSQYPRSELRELIDPRSSSRNWSLNGTHILRAGCKVLQAPSGGKVIIGQIHGYDAPPLIKLQWDDGVVFALFKNSPSGSDVKHSLGAIGLGQRFDYEIRVVDGLASVSANGTTRNYDFRGTDWMTNAFYYKAGAYVQDNAGPVEEGGRVAFYALTASHAAIQPLPLLPSITLQPPSVLIAATGLPNLTCTLETSTDLKVWTTLSATQPSSGAVRFTNSIASARRFFRLRSG